MAKVNRSGLDRWYEIADRWVNAALVKGDSLFTPSKAVWTLDGLNDLYHRYVDNFDAGEGDYFAKLDGQLADARPETRQLMAELLYLYYLPMAGNLKPDTKRNAVESVLSGVTPPVSLTPDLASALEAGIARESQAYVQQRYYQTKLLLEVMQKWWQLPGDQRERLLRDPWEFKSFVAQVPLYYNQAAQQMLLHIVHPDTFEPVMSGQHKEAIAESLANADERKIADLDRRLLAIRERMRSSSRS